MKKKLIGYVSVDSGQVMIIDPCYLSNYEDNNFVYKTGVRKGKKEYYCWQEIDGKKIRWDTPLKDEGGKCMNELAKNGWEHFSEYPDKGNFSYSGICGLTCDEQTGQFNAIGAATGVASVAGYGDGNYPVYALFNKEGRVKSLTIEFI